ncbi:40S ribosomal protein S3 [Echinococcus multilocularis]|uniref:40S ribosomal protein S3 n=1 Tax=Echinococcus multilocularis TaxID=6211 RepID=A0A0S4MLU3_ECHMU|nr:40S ribosomal protein S3 [Echinococcus multilocularis]
MPAPTWHSGAARYRLSFICDSRAYTGMMRAAQLIASPRLLNPPSGAVMRLVCPEAIDSADSDVAVVVG